MDFDINKYASGTGHPGYVFCIRRDAFEKLGGLIDWAILGSADRHMMMGLIDKIEFSYNKNIHPVYKKMCKIWQVRARHFIHRNISYLPGMITHFYHGSKQDRKYSSRWNILVDSQYNPELDLKRDISGLYSLTERNWRLKKEILGYFGERNEDCIYIDKN